MTSEIKPPGKLCGCGRLWTKLPPLSPWIDEGKLIGYTFNCSCHSTLFVIQNSKDPKIKELVNEALRSI